MTGKGDRWGRDRLGRSEPAFLSTTALPHLPARREADVICGCVFAARPANCGPFVLRSVPDGESAGCVCLQRFCSAGFVCACCHFLPAMPTALLNSCPRSFASSLLCPYSCAFACHLFIPCAPGSPLSRAGGLFSVRASSLPAARLSRWQLQHGPAVAARAPVHLTFFLFPCRVHDPGPWVSVEFIV